VGGWENDVSGCIQNKRDAVEDRWAFAPAYMVGTLIGTATNLCDEEDLLWCDILGTVPGW